MSDHEEYKPSVSADHDDEDDFVEEEPLSKKQKGNAGEKRKRDDSSSKDANDSKHVFQLSNRRRVAVRTFSNGTPSVDIREMYKDKNTGELKHGKGICLPLAQWETLKKLMPEIDEAITEIQKE